MTRSAVSPCVRWRRVVSVVVAIIPLVAPLGPVRAQDGYAREVVQPLPDPATQQLSEALRRLADDPQGLDALVAAGEASLALEDVDAAEGFFQRAQAVAPEDGRVKAGLASLLVRRQQPVEALRLFAEAEQAGVLTVAHIAERGLAYDLIGDNARAQQDYTVALSAGADSAITRRLALSQAIAGDQRASEATLLPLLQRSDLAAFRTRAFALAILGETDEAVTIAETMLPPRLSSRMAPYLRYMPRLTAAQQAAAANLGRFPQAAQIGRDDPAVAAYSPQSAPRQPTRSADSRLVPSGEPLGSRGGVPRREDAAAPIVRAAVQQPAPEPEPQLPPEPEPQLPPEPAPQVVAADAPEPQPIAAVSSQTSGEPSPPSAPLTADATPAPPSEIDLAVAFADFSLPARPAGPAAGAVDITAIEPKREAPPRAEPAPPPAPVHPSRHWLQVATGRDTAALAFDWRRIRRAAGGLLDKRTPHIADWGQTHRLVAGPFATAREVDELVAELREKEIDTFRFTSERGEEVRPLD